MTVHSEREIIPEAARLAAANEIETLTGFRLTVVFNGLPGDYVEASTAIHDQPEDVLAALANGAVTSFFLDSDGAVQLGLFSCSVPKQS